MTCDDIAKVCHEANRAFCEVRGDKSQPPWEGAPAWQKTSARNGVYLHIAHPGLGDSASHEAWMTEKLGEGWTWGPEKRPDIKQHPCMVPFDHLPPEQQAKDKLFRSIVTALAHLASR